MASSPRSYFFIEGSCCLSRRAACGCNVNRSAPASLYTPVPCFLRQHATAATQNSLETPLDFYILTPPPFLRSAFGLTVVFPTAAVTRQECDEAPRECVTEKHGVSHEDLDFWQPRPGIPESRRMALSCVLAVMHLQNHS